MHPSPIDCYRRVVINEETTNSTPSQLHLTAGKCSGSSSPKHLLSALPPSPSNSSRASSSGPTALMLRLRSQEQRIWPHQQQRISELAMVFKNLMSEINQNKARGDQGSTAGQTQFSAVRDRRSTTKKIKMWPLLSVDRPIDRLRKKKQRTESLRQSTAR